MFLWGISIKLVDRKNYKKNLGYFATFVRKGEYKGVWKLEKRVK